VSQLANDKAISLQMSHIQLLEVFLVCSLFSVAGMGSNATASSIMLVSNNVA
jgi:hypothetical protein